MSQSMILPNFMFVGTGKSATSSIFASLATHPDIGLAQRWEPNFFSNDEIFENGINWYSELFRHCALKIAIGEKSWRYSVHAIYPNAIERIRKFIPELKVLYVVRDPVVRAQSLWIEFRSSGVQFVNPVFSDAISKDAIFVESSLYNKQINFYRSEFGNKNVCVLFYEDFVRNPHRFLNKICAHINVKPLSKWPDIRMNGSSGKRVDTPVVDHLRRLPFFSAVRDGASNEIRSICRNVFKRQVKPILWTTDAKQFFIHQIGNDAQEFLAQFGTKDIEWQEYKKFLELA